MPFVTIHINFEGDEEQRARSFSVSGEVCDFGDMLGEILSNTDMYHICGADYQVARAIRIMESHCPDTHDDFTDVIVTAKRLIRVIDEVQVKHKQPQTGEYIGG